MFPSSFRNFTVAENLGSSGAIFYFFVDNVCSIFRFSSN
ncbi:hypothetical protein M6B38_150015 [Iris pallida]|uniref:Uncharacterized protein n=1 Tax=Iris pallida TaxID=29817 RepID=A0AAX6F7G4_IRIPA|nr:hypothetical protein M6B38_150015 [Iris pallida]